MLQLSSNVGNRTFAVLLQRDLHVGCGNITLLTALLANSRPAVAFILLDNIHHLLLFHHQCALIRTCGPTKHTKEHRHVNTDIQYGDMQNLCVL